VSRECHAACQTAAHADWDRAGPGRPGANRPIGHLIETEFETIMQIGTSIFLIALGAILRYAVHVSTSGFSIHTAGFILMIVGVIGLVASLLFATVWAGRRRTDVERPVVRERDVY
jgi:hypothetical protein